MSLRCIKINKLFNYRLTSFKVNNKILNQLSTKTIDPTDEIKKKQLINQKAVSDEKRRIELSNQKDEEISDETVKKKEKDKEKKKKKERVAINTYPNNPPALMEFFDDPKNWAEETVASGKLCNSDNIIFLK